MFLSFFVNLSFLLLMLFLTLVMYNKTCDLSSTFKYIQLFFDLKLNKLIGLSDWFNYKAIDIPKIKSDSINTINNKEGSSIVLLSTLVFIAILFIS